MKYPIKKEFFPFSRVAPPIQSAALAGKLGALMRPPLWLWHDKQMTVKRLYALGYDGEKIEMLLLSPSACDEPMPCLVYYHGGGFFFGAAGYHYANAKQYVLGTPCKLLFVQYRLAPRHPHPTPAEDCYSALRYAFLNAEQLGIDADRIAVGGDSAGGALAAAVTQMARDRKTDAPCAALLVYPVTDRRMISESAKRYTDTPMWNSRLSKMMWAGYVQDVNPPNLAYASPMEARSFASLPRTYLETAEFDCLRDEGIAYAESLRAAGVRVTLNQTVGTMHGFDIVSRAPTTKEAIAARIAYLKEAFERKSAVQGGNKE